MTDRVPSCTHRVFYFDRLELWEQNGLSELDVEQNVSDELAAFEPQSASRYQPPERMSFQLMICSSYAIPPASYPARRPSDSRPARPDAYAHRHVRLKRLRPVWGVTRGDHGRVRPITPSCSPLRTCLADPLGAARFAPLVIVQTQATPFVPSGWQLLGDVQAEPISCFFFLLLRSLGHVLRSFHTTLSLLRNPYSRNCCCELARSHVRGGLPSARIRFVAALGILFGTSPPVAS